MKNFLLSVLLLVFSCALYAQEPSGVPTQNYNGKWARFGGYMSVDKGLLTPVTDTNWTPMRAGAITNWQGNFWGYNGARWALIGSSLTGVEADSAFIFFDKKYFNGDGSITFPITLRNVYTITQIDSIVNAITNGGGGNNSAFNGNRPITRDFSTVTGINLGTTTLGSTLDQFLYPSQPPTATLTGGSNVELMATGAALTPTLSWSAGRQASTATLQSVVVAGVTKTFTQPNPSAAVSGTQAVTITRNVNTSFSNIVTTTDGKGATASTTFNFFANRYWGFVATGTPTDVTVQGLAKEFITTRTKAQIATPISPTGSQYFVIAFPASFDPTNVTTIWINGLDQTGTFTRTVRSFTNASGYAQSYIIFITTNPTSGAVQFEIK